MTLREEVRTLLNPFAFAGDPRVVDSLVAFIEARDAAQIEACALDVGAKLDADRDRNIISDWRSGYSAARFSAVAIIRSRLTAPTAPTVAEMNSPDYKRTIVASVAEPTAQGESGDAIESQHRDTWTLADLRDANTRRQVEWCKGGDALNADMSFRAMELGGETGEALNVAKKLERERHGWPGSRATVDELAQELADVIICADLLAFAAGIDLMAAVRDKFNKTTTKIGLTVYLESAAREQLT